MASATRPTVLLKQPSAILPWRAALLVLLVALGAYANSVLTEGRVVEALTSAYWPQAVSGAGLYGHAFELALEWRLWKGHPAGFHLGT